MGKSYPLLKHLTEQLMKEVVKYGILEVSTEQYQNVCNCIIRFADSMQDEAYSSQLMETYRESLDKRYSRGEICKEYRRFQLRVIRMISSLAETGTVDFSNTLSQPRKYLVTSDINDLIEEILDSFTISEATKRDLRAPTRHFFWYAQQRNMDPMSIDDTTVMSFIIDEIPVSNGGSTGRTLRCVKYATEYLKKRGNHNIRRNYKLLKLKNDHRRIIPAYSEKEIADIVGAADTDDALCRRDLAIVLMAYCTGLRGIDIINLKIPDIDWLNHKVSVIQSKTHKGIVAELNGTTMNALADYILEWRPKCDIPEVFITVKAPYRRLSKGFGSMIDKYCERAGIPKIAFRGFHSIRRAFETVMISRGVSIETASQMMGHKTINEEKPYITHDKNKVAFVAMGFSDVPISFGFYSSHGGDVTSRNGGDRS